MTNLKFYSGLREIGGTVVAVETDKAICIFDFGYAHADRIDDKVKVRKDKVDCFLVFSDNLVIVVQG